MKNFTLLFAIVLSVSLYAEEFDFAGRHLVASYMGCDQQALTDVEQLTHIMKHAVNATGAQVLSSSKFVFPGNGLTMVFLLSESHASIHTYPEHGACFVDLFTCGQKCRAEAFEEVLEAYLQPAQIDKHHYLRSTETVEEKN